MKEQRFDDELVVGEICLHLMKLLFPEIFHKLVPNKQRFHFIGRCCIMKSFTPGLKLLFISGDIAI
jgi:hypothetical protein